MMQVETDSPVLDLCPILLEADETSTCGDVWSGYKYKIDQNNASAERWIVIHSSLRKTQVREEAAIHPVSCTKSERRL